MFLSPEQMHLFPTQIFSNWFVFVTLRWASWQSKSSKATENHRSLKLFDEKKKEATSILLDEQRNATYSQRTKQLVDALLSVIIARSGCVVSKSLQLIDRL